MYKTKIPYNDIFFYGLSLKNRDASDVRSDIFANILMKYLRTLKPVSNRLFRTADDFRYEYNYSFIPSKPLSWRVIKNRRVIEEIEYLSDGKYCLNYYDDLGKDSKRVMFSNQHRWLKTNYYSSVNGVSILCSLVPKEQDGETVILQYTTGDSYSKVLYCCPVASCKEVLDNVLARVPEPELMALTNFGILYFAVEETFNIYKQILIEEEDKYSEAHKPEVFTTEEDIAGGFGFTLESFDSTSQAPSIFNLSEAQELTDDNYPVYEEKSEVAEDSCIFESVSDAQEDFSVDSDISNIIKTISDATSIKVDESLVLHSEQSSDLSEDESITSEPVVNSVSATELLDMEDPDIDDYVSSLIDSILLDAKSSASELLIDREGSFTAGAQETLQSDNSSEIHKSFIDENIPDQTIESNGSSYFYYGALTDDGKRDGRGKTLMASGVTAYEGDYKDDMRHGVGSFYYKDGSLCYWGGWSRNMRKGFGLGISSETGVAHIGSWNNNKPTGIGVRFDSDGRFMYLDSACEKTNGGIRVTGFTESSVIVEIWDEKSLRTVKKEISIEDILNFS